MLILTGSYNWNNEMPSTKNDTIKKQFVMEIEQSEDVDCLITSKLKKSQVSDRVSKHLYNA